MKICCIGAGYVGGTSMAVMAQQCLPDVVESITIVDQSESRIAAWNSKDYDLPIYEPGLLEIIQAHRGKNLFYSTDSTAAIEAADIVFVAVNAPTKASGIGAGMAQDLVYCEQSARLIAEVATTSKIVVEQGSFPVQTAQCMARILQDNGQAEHVVLSNPIFYSQGSAIKDLQTPARILIGGGSAAASKDSAAALQTLVDLYAAWVPQDRIITTNLWSAELAKLVANAMLAQRISSINSISALCEKTAADVTEISQVIGMDSRIGKQYLQAGVGFGKSRFRKDISSLVYLCQSLGLNECAAYWNSVITINEFQKRRFATKIVRHMFNTVTHKKIVMLGYAFKKNTGDVRETPSMYILKDLLQEEAFVHVYDPKVKRSDMLAELDAVCDVNADNTPNLDRMAVTANDPYEACDQAHAILLLTDWDEFKHYDYAKLYESMTKPAFLFDGRNLLDHDALRRIGFEVHGIGKHDPNDIALQD
jgi:UDPglucose 6-dehydrogenase